MGAHESMNAALPSNAYSKMLTVALAVLLAGSARCCNDPDAVNFGNVGDDCIIGGCTNKNAVNYDPKATADYDASCRFSSCPHLRLDSRFECYEKVKCWADCCLDPKADNFAADVSKYLEEDFIEGYGYYVEFSTFSPGEIEDNMPD